MIEQNNPSTSSTAEGTECKECGGKGEIDSNTCFCGDPDCAEPGQDTFILCPACNGTGVVEEEENENSKNKISRD